MQGIFDLKLVCRREPKGLNGLEGFVFGKTYYAREIHCGQFTIYGAIEIMKDHLVSLGVVESKIILARFFDIVQRGVVRFPE